MVQAAVAAREVAKNNLVVTAGLSFASCRATTAHEGTLCMQHVAQETAQETLRDLSNTASE